MGYDSSHTTCTERTSWFMLIGTNCAWRMGQVDVRWMGVAERIDGKQTSVRSQTHSFRPHGSQICMLSPGFRVHFCPCSFPIFSSQSGRPVSVDLNCAQLECVCFIRWCRSQPLAVMQHSTAQLSAAKLCCPLCSRFLRIPIVPTTTPPKNTALPSRWTH